MILIAFAISFLFFIAAWSAVQKTALDTSRDHLFDLRDEVRERFLTLPGGLNNPLYRQLRDHLNRYIRFTERMHFIGMMLFVARLPDHLLKEIDEQLEKKYKSDDPILKEYTRKIRSRSAVIMQKYMMLSSITVMCVLAVSFPVMIVKLLQGGLRSAFVSFRHILKRIMDADKYTRPKTLEIVASYS
jgi:hypothetical protein